jgi:type VI secretion system secreted protein Hcp
MAVDMFLKLEGIKGESKDDKHPDEIEVLSWSWGMSQSGTMHTGTGGGAGKVNMQDISVMKWTDRSTHNLMMYCSNGKHIPKGWITVRKAGEKQQEYVKIEMTDIIVSSVQVGGADGSSDRLTESLSLNFAKVKFEYAPQKEDGSLDSHLPVTIDMKTMKVE